MFTLKYSIELDNRTRECLLLGQRAGVEEEAGHYSSNPAAGGGEQATAGLPHM